MKKYQQIYDGLQAVIKRYMVIDPQHFKTTSLWIMGTYFHKLFQTYPYLYLNATKGSGKTRLLKLISFFAKNGRVLALPSEAFLFRKADTMTFCLDELENLQQKEQGNLRLLLNTAYKKGLFIPRVNSDKKDQAGQMVTEEFETFAPMCFANIGGLDSVLQDRAISVIIDKSNDGIVTKKIEVWELERDCKEIKRQLDSINFEDKEISFFGITSIKDLMIVPIIWNALLENLRETEDFDQAFAAIDWDIFSIEPSAELLKFLKMLYDVQIEGRDLELWLPIFFLAYMVSEVVLKEMILIATSSTEQKKVDEIGQNIDNDLIAVLADFIKDKKELEFFKPNDIKNALLEVVGEEKPNKDGSTRMEAPYWLNVKWIGHALKRLNIVKSKRRRAYGFEIMLDFGKVLEKARVIGCLYTPTQTTLTTQTTQTTPENDVDDVVSVVSVDDVVSVDVDDDLGVPDYLRKKGGE